MSRPEMWFVNRLTHFLHRVATSPRILETPARVRPSCPQRRPYNTMSREISFHIKYQVSIKYQIQLIQHHRRVNTNSAAFIPVANVIFYQTLSWYSIWNAILLRWYSHNFETYHHISALQFLFLLLPKIIEFRLLIQRFEYYTHERIIWRVVVILYLVRHCVNHNWTVPWNSWNPAIPSIYVAYCCSIYKKNCGGVGYPCTCMFPYRTQPTKFRPLLEYNSVIRPPSQIGLINNIESVQRSFTKRLPGFINLSYADRLLYLNLQSFEHRRLCYDLVTCYNIEYNRIANTYWWFFHILSQPFFTWSPSPTCTSISQNKLTQILFLISSY